MLGGVGKDLADVVAGDDAGGDNIEDTHGGREGVQRRGVRERVCVCAWECVWENRRGKEREKNVGANRVPLFIVHGGLHHRVAFPARPYSLFRLFHPRSPQADWTARTQLARSLTRCKHVGIVYPGYRLFSARPTPVPQKKNKKQNHTPTGENSDASPSLLLLWYSFQYCAIYRAGNPSPT